MLRRKLLIIFGSLVILLLGMAVAGVWMLHDLLQQLDHVNTEAYAIVDRTTQLNAALTAVEIELYQLQVAEKRHLDVLIRGVDTMRRLLAEIDSHYMIDEPETAASYQELRAKYPLFERSVSSLATAQDVGLARQYNLKALAAAASLRENVSHINAEAREHARREQVELAERFRWLILGVALGCMLLINISIIVLLRAAAMVLRPVDQLVETSRQLTREDDDHRTDPGLKDEFAELAGAYRALAERVQAHEQRQMETLGQAALTLNHELNNAMATIELQLQILSRQAKGDDRFESPLRQIRENLQRMAKTVESLKNIRRIVLTEYVAGVKMLDLERSTQSGAAHSDAPSGSAGDQENA
ncbi:MAG: HAMP domain-containing protein [Planctomycetota bacterium]|jgi:signal transduction histidine kinase